MVAAYPFLQARRYAEAKPHIRQALEIWQRLTAEHPDNAHHRYDLAISHNNLGVLLSETSEFEEAESAYREAIRIRAQLAAEFPNVPRYEVYLARSQYNLGIVLNDMGRLEEAQQAYRQAAEIHQRKVDESPGNAQYQSNLAAALNNLARLLTNRSEFVDARDLFERAIDHQQLALKASPRRPRYRDDLRNCYDSQAWLLATCPDHELRDAGRAVELANKSVELIPSIAASWDTLGAAQYRAGDWQAAIEALNKSVELGDGGDSYAFFFLAMAHWQLGDQTQARQWYDQAVEWMDENDPDEEELQRFRAEANELIGIDAAPAPKSEPEAPARD